MKINEITKTDSSGFLKQYAHLRSKPKQYKMIDAEEIEEMISRDCSQFLEESHGIPLWRGVSGGYHQRIVANGIIQIPATKNRNSTSEDGFDAMGANGDLMYRFMNQDLQKKFGMTRAQSYLFSGDKNVAESYGSPHKCFPLDGYEYLWAPRVVDYADDLIEIWDKEFNDEAGNYDGDPDEYEWAHNETVETFVDRAQYRTTNLIEALKFEGGVEIMVKGAFYIVD